MNGMLRVGAFIQVHPFRRLHEHTLVYEVRDRCDTHLGGYNIDISLPKFHIFARQKLQTLPTTCSDKPKRFGTLYRNTAKHNGGTARERMYRYSPVLSTH